MSTELFTLGDYPTVIEPTLGALEVTGGTRSSEDPLRLERIDTERVRRSFVLPEQLVHFFGDGDSETARHILCYTASGRLSHFLHLGSEEWELTELPAEVTGDKVLNPSARLVFKDVRSRSVFLHYLQQVQEGKIQNPTIAVMLASLVEPIRQIEVWGAAPKEEDDSDE